MIDVDDEIANLQVAQVGEKRLRETAALLRRAALLFEDIRLCVDLQSRVGKTESSRERADCHQDCGGMGVRVLDRHRDDVVLAKDLDGPLCASGTVGDEQYGVARSRACRTSAIQSPTRPRNSIAG